MRKKIWKKGMAFAVATCLSVSMLAACGEEEGQKKETAKSESSEENESTTEEQNEGAKELPAFEVKESKGAYASLKAADMADEESEEIMDLVNGRHFIDQSFDDTEYATTIEDAHEGTWGIYIYMCGSDLESGSGAATSDLMEMLDAKMSKDVNLVIQTGGSTVWQNEQIDPNYLERYVCNSKGFECVDQTDSASMGAQDTLEDFLKFCDENYPADNQMVIFWNHGGGSLGGACYDEIYNYDHLTLNEIDQAFSNAFGEKRIEAIGFDCCLMASIDTANICKNHAEMMIASEETEPGNGWYYTDWLNALCADTSMSNAELGKSICDSYMTGCEMVGTQDATTLSAIDLNKINLLVDRINLLSTEMFYRIAQDGSVMAQVGRAAGKTENYGGNTDSSGYFDVLDIGDFIENVGDGYFETQEMLKDALNQAVVYHVYGDLRAKSTGLSMYYPYDKSLASQQKYESVAASDLYAGVNRMMLTGELSDQMLDLLTLYCEKTEEVEEVSSDDLASSTENMTFTNNGEDLSVNIDDEGYLSVDIGADNIQNVESVTAQLLLYLEDQDTFLCVGVDNDVNVDWDKGVITDNFRGVWACMDGHYLYMDICYEGEDYNLYTVPILLNGERKDMTVAYYYDTESYEVVGVSDAVDSTSSNQCASKETQMLKKGDKITTLFYYYDDSSEDWVEMELETFKYKKNSSIIEEDLGDGVYAIMFMTSDIAGNEVYSDYGFISYQDGEMEAYTE